MLSRISNWLSPNTTNSQAQSSWLPTLTKVAAVAAGIGLAGLAIYSAYNNPSTAISAALPASAKLFQTFAERPICLDSASSKIWTAFAAASTATCPNFPPIPLTEQMVAIAGIATVILVPSIFIYDTIRICCCKKPPATESEMPEVPAEEDHEDLHDGMGAPDPAFAYGASSFGHDGSSAGWYDQTKEDYLGSNRQRTHSNFYGSGQSYPQGSSSSRPFFTPPAPSSFRQSPKEAKKQAEIALQAQIKHEEETARIQAKIQEETILLPQAQNNLNEALSYLGFDKLPNLEILNIKVRKLLLENHPDKIIRFSGESDTIFEARRAQATQKTQMINHHREMTALVIKYTPQSKQHSIPLDSSRFSSASSSSAAAAAKQDVDALD